MKAHERKSRKRVKGERGGGKQEKKKTDEEEKMEDYLGKVE